VESTTELGHQLRSAREAQGLTLQDVAATTKIAPGALSAIEREDFDELPAGIFRREFVRVYAAAVGLDGRALAQAYVARFEPPRPPSDPAPPPHSLALAPRAIGVAIGLVAFGVLLVLWAGTPPVVTEAGDAAGVAVEPAPVVAAGPPSVRTGPDASAERTIVPLRLRLEATGRCWVTAHADGRRVVSRLVEPGEVVLVDARSVIRLRLGDAGAVSGTLNGVAGPPLGRRGQPVTVHLTPAGWRLPDDEDSEV
jgi:cytoskeletal protein RodZ